MTSEKKSWADIADEEDLVVPVVISKHGIKVKYTPPHQRSIDKSLARVESKKDDSSVPSVRRSVQ
jgi:hypothetical protein